jgi:hypothetical protein
MTLGFSPSVSGRSRRLPVPYFAQPNETDCQSTCLKMFALYLEQQGLPSAKEAAATLDIPAIKKEINGSPNRPDKEYKNSHENMRWWLGEHFPALAFVRESTTDPVEALEKIIAFIDSEMPVIVSVSHKGVKGHIVMVVGFQNYTPYQSSADFSLEVHDPYGQFDPELLSKLNGKKRREGGMSLMRGGEKAPGMNCRLPLTSISRRRAGDKALGAYYLLSARKQ